MSLALSQRAFAGRTTLLNSHDALTIARWHPLPQPPSTVRRRRTAYSSKRRINDRSRGDNERRCRGRFEVKFRNSPAPNGRGNEKSLQPLASPLTSLCDSLRLHSCNLTRSARRWLSARHRLSTLARNDAIFTPAVFCDEAITGNEGAICLILRPRYRTPHEHPFRRRRCRDA